MTTITLANVATAKTSDLVAFYNRFAETPVKKFSTRPIAVARVTKLLEMLETIVPTKAPAKAKVRRCDVVREILEVDCVTIEYLAARFKTAYKNITGDFYQLRNEGVTILKVRIDGENRFQASSAEAE